MFYPLDWPPALVNAAAFLIGYLLGSIPFGLILTRWAGTPDIRTIGSGKTGPFTRALQEAYRAAVSGNHPRSAGWLARIDVEGRSSRAVDERRVASPC